MHISKLTDVALVLAEWDTPKNVNMAMVNINFHDISMLIRNLKQQARVRIKVDQSKISLGLEIVGSYTYG